MTRVAFTGSWFAAPFALVFSLSLAFSYATYDAPPIPRVHVRWSEAVTPSQQDALEATYQLREPDYQGERTWLYEILDTSTDNLRQLVQDPAAEDTQYVDRVEFRLTEPSLEPLFVLFRFLVLSSLLSIVVASFFTWVGPERWGRLLRFPLVLIVLLRPVWLWWSQTRHLRRIAPFLWIAYLLVPVSGWGLFDGRPLGLTETLALVVVVWIWASKGSLLGPLVGTALLGKLVLGTALLVPSGFEARYYANPNFVPPVERSLDRSRSGTTRIDDRLRFGKDGAPDLPVYFLNDPARFNFYLEDQPDRRTLPVSVVWNGTLRVAESGPHRFYARATAGTVEMMIGSALNVQVPPSSTAWTREVDLTAGYHPVLITLAIPQGGARDFEAGRVVEDRELPFDSTVISPRPVQTAALAIDQALRVLSVIVDLVLSSWLVISFSVGLGNAWRKLKSSFAVRDALAVASVPVIGEAFVWAVPAFERMITLSGGNDWLTYEALGREIALNGVWMASGAPLGQGASFYFQPLYPYFLAVCHWVFGESLFGVHFVQRLLVAATVVALWRTTAVLFNERVGAAGLAAAMVFGYAKLAAWADVLLSEVLFVPLVCIWTYMLVRLAQRHRGPDTAAQVSPAHAVAVGILGGVATLTRSTLVLGWLVALPVLAFALKSRRGTTLALIVATMVAVTSLATLRNWVVAREFVPISSSGPVNLYLGNRPAIPLTPQPEHQAFYDRLGLNPNYTQPVAEYIRQQPRAFLAGLAQKAKYTLGWFETRDPGSGRSNFYVATWAAALAGLLLIGRVAPSRPGWAVVIPAALALTHFAIMVIIKPWGYGDRLILPFYALLVPYVGVTIFVAYRLVTAPLPYLIQAVSSRK